MKRFFQQPATWVIAGAVGVGIFLVVMIIVFRPQSPVSPALKKQLSFVVFYPDNTSGYKVDSRTVSYDTKTKVLLFHAKSAANDLTVTEQQAPDQFTDIPDYYPKLIEKLNGYSDFDSLDGKVSLTRPTELNGGQSAVFDGKGTLLFIHPLHDVSNDDWRKLFDSLAVGT